MASKKVGSPNENSDYNEKLWLEKGRFERAFLFYLSVSWKTKNRHLVINTSLSKSFLSYVLGPTHAYPCGAGKPVGQVRLEHSQPVPVVQKVNRLHLWIAYKKRWFHPSDMCCYWFSLTMRTIFNAPIPMNIVFGLLFHAICLKEFLDH